MHWWNMLTPEMKDKIARNQLKIIEKRGDASYLRGQHPYGHALIKGITREHKSLPAELAKGIFDKVNPINVEMRLSNGRVKKDYIPDIHGVGIKFHFEDKPVDILLSDSESFFTDNVEDIDALLNAQANGGAWKLFFTHPKLMWNIITSFKIRRNLLLTTYWSQLEWQLGDQKVKFKLVPKSKDVVNVDWMWWSNYLRRRISDHVWTKDTYFQLVILWNNCEWPAFVLHFPPQDIDLLISEEENIAFNVNNCLPDLFPIGDLQELRKHVYKLSADLRTHGWN